MFAEARRDLNAAGSALGKFPLPGIRGSVGSGQLKVASSISRRALSQGPRFALSSLNELHQVAARFGLPSCAVR